MANALRDFDITNPTTLDILNSQISDVTNDAFSTPYMALERVRKVLSYFSIFLPAYRFMDSEEGNTVFQIDQFGKEAGWDLDAKEIKMEKDDSGLFLYFEWGADVDGLYTIFSEVVNEDELNELLDAFDNDDEEPADPNVEVYIDHSFEPQEDETMNMEESVKLAAKEVVTAILPGVKTGMGITMRRFTRWNSDPRKIKNDLKNLPAKDIKNIASKSGAMPERAELQKRLARKMVKKMNEEKDIDIAVPKTLLSIKTKFAKTVEAESEKDRENEMASGRPVNEGMMDMNKRYFKRAIADRKLIADKKKEEEAKSKDQPKKVVKEARESEDNDRTGSDRTEHSKFTAAVRKLYPNAPKGKSLAAMKASAKKAVADVMKEENLQELSDSLLTKYHDKATAQKDEINRQIDKWPHPGDKRHKGTTLQLIRKSGKRERGADLAYEKILHRDAKVFAKD